MKLKNSRWTMVMVGVIAFLVLATMVWASPPAGAPSAPLQAYDATNADKVDNHHAGPSSGTLNQRKNRVLWANNQGQLHWKAMPKAALNSRYLNDDRKETIKAAVEGTLLTVNNIGTGSDVRGLYAYGEDRGMSGISITGIGVHGYSDSGTAVRAHSNSGLPLNVASLSGSNLIEAWDFEPVTDALRFKVTRSGDVYIDALLTVRQYSAAPATCDTGHDGAIALTSGYRMCVCKDGGGWVYTSDGTTSCSW